MGLVLWSTWGLRASEQLWRSGLPLENWFYIFSYYAQRKHARCYHHFNVSPLSVGGEITNTKTIRVLPRGEKDNWLRSRGLKASYICLPLPSGDQGSQSIKQLSVEDNLASRNSFHFIKQFVFSPVSHCWSLFQDQPRIRLRKWLQREFYNASVLVKFQGLCAPRIGSLIKQTLS